MFPGVGVVCCHLENRDQEWRATRGWRVPLVHTIHQRESLEVLTLSLSHRERPLSQIGHGRTGYDTAYSHGQSRGCSSVHCRAGCEIKCFERRVLCFCRRHFVPLTMNTPDLQFLTQSHLFGKLAPVSDGFNRDKLADEAPVGNSHCLDVAQTSLHSRLWLSTLESFLMLPLVIVLTSKLKPNG